MTPNRQGFYRITFDGGPGVGHCTHKTSAIYGYADYESWSLLFWRSDAGEQHLASTVISSRDEILFPKLVIGKRIRGLPA